MILYLGTRYAILIHRDWQLSWRFYLFDRVTSFLHRDTQVCRRFHNLNKIRNFYRVDILHFPATLWKKTIVPIDAAHVPWPEATKIWKSPKTDLRKNSATTCNCIDDICCVHRKMFRSVAASTRRCKCLLDSSPQVNVCTIHSQINVKGPVNRNGFFF